MNDLRIVIVSWNVKDLLGRCLASLPAACEGLQWDVVVVDNASTDESVDVVRRVGAQHAVPLRIVANKENRGFAKACNQGMAGSDARYVLLLNPDTECPAGSLRQFVRLADQYPRAGIFGSALTYPDGKPQSSVRPFPTVWNQAGILLKLHRAMPWLPTFQRYFGNDQNLPSPLLRKEGEKILPLAKGELEGVPAERVDQVMGACFLIRRELIEAIGGLDERYFIWFEEVDYCREAKKRGWDVLFLPSVSVTHHGGQSFVQVFTTTKQRNFNRSLISYFQKWHPGWRACLIRIVAPISILITKTLQALQTPLGRIAAWVFLLALLDVISVSTVFWPVPRTIATVVVGALLFLVTLRRPDLGLAAVALELAVGSKGALLKIPNGWDFDHGTSLRIVMFVAFLAGWGINWLFMRGKAYNQVPLRERLPWIALIALCGWGFVRGVMLKNSNVMGDANAWVFLALLLPVLDLATRDGKRLMSSIFESLTAALLWLPIKTLLLLYVWSHGIRSLSKPLYLWVRRTGVAEVTLVSGNLFRVFIQSQIYAVVGFFLAAAHAIEVAEKRDRWLSWTILVLSSVSICISLSRSFWIGFLVGFACLGWFGIRFAGERGLVRGSVRIAAGFIVGLGLIAATVAFPIPHVEVGSLKSLFGSRGSVTDAAAESRWNLLPKLYNKIQIAPILGSGFGATVTYQSRDPRILAQHPDGTYTTYTFEWGWLEHWIKFGILGIPVMAWLVISLMVRTWKTNGAWWVRAGFISSLIALAALHVFTPYLNHPLGFGILLLVEGWITAQAVRAV